MTILDANTFEFISRSADQTKRIGMRLGGFLNTGDVICLCGELGAGKTTLTQGIAHGWGSIDPVKSPTFVLVRNYRRADRAEMNHLDAYRLNSGQEAEDLDLDIMIEKGPLIIEWPDKIVDALPEENLWIELGWVSDQQRNLTIKAAGKRYQFLLLELKNNMVKSFI